MKLTCKMIKTLQCISLLLSVTLLIVIEIMTLDSMHNILILWLQWFLRRGNFDRI